MTLEPVTPHLERLCRAIVEIAEPLVVGDTPLGRRRIIPITGGRVDGPRLQGVVLPGGADWQIVRADGGAVLEARYTIRAVDGALIYVRNIGLRHRGLRHRGLRHRGLRHRGLRHRGAAPRAARGAGAARTRRAAGSRRLLLPHHAALRDRGAVVRLAQRRGRGGLGGAPASRGDPGLLHGDLRRIEPLGGARIDRVAQSG
jgi:hypothetical protein